MNSWLIDGKFGQGPLVRGADSVQTTLYILVRVSDIYIGVCHVVSRRLPRKSVFTSLTSFFPCTALEPESPLTR